MGFFRRGAPATAAPLGVPPMGSGRRLRSSLDPAGCVAVIDAVVSGYRPPPYEHMPSSFPAGHTWIGAPEEAPTSAVCFSDSADDFVLATLRPQTGGTEIGLFPLGSGDERLQAMSITGHWKQRDGSLSSIGLVPPASVRLAAPRLPAGYLEEIVAFGGFRPVPGNVEALGEMIGQMFLVKAGQFLGSVDQRLADRFVDAHRYAGGDLPAHLQRILDDLVATEAGVTPYIQDLPWRVRALLLDTRGSDSSVWARLV